MSYAGRKIVKFSTTVENQAALLSLRDGGNSLTEAISNVVTIVRLSIGTCTAFPTVVIRMLQ